MGNNCEPGSVPEPGSHSGADHHSEMGCSKNYTFEGCVQLCLDMQKLCVAINVHAYLFGALFLILVFTACFALVPLIRNKKAGSKPSFMITINVLVIIFGLMRSLYLFVDAYGIKGYMKSVGALLFADLAIPCLTSAFALVQWAFLELLQVRRINSALQKPSILIAIVISHFAFVAAIDFMLYYLGRGVCFLMTVCQIVTVIWGLILTFGFLYTTQKLVKRDREHRLTLKRTQYVFTNKQSTIRKKSPNDETNNSIKSEQNELINTNTPRENHDSIKTISGQNTTQSMQANNGNTNGSTVEVVTVIAPVSETDPEPDQQPENEDVPIIIRPLRRLRRTFKSKSIIRKSYLTKVKNVGICTTLIGIGLFSVSIYGIIAIYNPFEGAPQPDDWGWYTFQTIHRLVST
ncbi:uncharacterized protein [Amphiura filiformis]|uniref:uncharacterized protein n=1 Tax=Amphiura filiformis TaxID=82378 RepID=UPI003B212886